MNVQSRIDPAVRLNAATGPLPLGHPAVKPRRIGILLTNLGTPGRHRLLVDAPLSQGIPLGPARHRGQPAPSGG